MGRRELLVGWRCLVATLLTSAMLAGLLVVSDQRPAAAAVTSVRGSACGYLTNVGLFGGPQALRGCGQSGTAPATAASPSVALTSNGSNSPQSANDPDGAKATYGPAAIFAGLWPDNVASAPPSGPMSVSTQGTPSGGSVTSTADLVLNPTPIPVGCETGYSPPCTAPGGTGGQVDADEVHATCTATPTGVTGSTRFVNAILTTSTDAEGGPATQEPLPDNPPPNYVRSVPINNVGGHPTIVLNEQLVNPDGSLTVNAYHMYLLGPIAVGEKIVGQVTCGTTPSPLTPKDTTGPICGLRVVGQVGPDDPTPASPRTELDGVVDSGGLQSISNIEVVNGTVQVGEPSSEYAHLRFVPGQKGPLPVTATRSDAAEAARLPLIWSFDATDVAGNTTRCQRVMPTALSVNNVSTNEGNAGTTAVSFTITRAGDPSKPVTASYKTTDGTASAGTDYTAVAPTTVSFLAGETSRTVTVNVAADTAAENDETFNLVLSAPSGAVVADSSGSATILNDDGSAYLAVNSLSMAEGNSGSSPATFTVTRSGNTTGASTVSYRTTSGTATAGTDYTAVAATQLAFTPGQTTRTVTVDVVGDTGDEVNETFNLVLSAPVGATISDASGSMTIVDDEGTVTAGPKTFLSVGDISLIEGNSGTTSATYTVRRSGDTTGASTVKYNTADGTATAATDYTGVPLTTLSFGAGETAKAVTVGVGGDSLPEANETVKLVLSSVTGATIADSSGIATVRNDDGSAYLAVGNVWEVEGPSGTTPLRFTIVRSGNTTGPSTVTYRTADATATAGTDYSSIDPTAVTFAPGQTLKTVTVDVTGDSTAEPNETMKLTLSAATGATITDATGTATILNDD